VWNDVCPEVASCGLHPMPSMSCQRGIQASLLLQSRSLAVASVAQLTYGFLCPLL